MRIYIYKIKDNRPITVKLHTERNIFAGNRELERDDPRKSLSYVVKVCAGLFL